MKAGTPKIIFPFAYGILDTKPPHVGRAGSVVANGSNFGGHYERKRAFKEGILKKLW